MASDRLAELLRSTSELTEEEISGMTERDAWELIHAGPLNSDNTEEGIRGSRVHQISHQYTDRD